MAMKLWRKPLDYPEKAATPGEVHIDKDRCKGCGYCVKYCPRNVLKMTRELSPKGYFLAAVDDETRCLACGYCEAICPEFAVKVATPVKNNSKD